MAMLLLLAAASVQAARAAVLAPPAASAAAATVFAEPEQGPGPGKGEVGAELLRFVTAYKKGLEALVDITPHAPLLQSAADSNGMVNFYGFIDTWVDNSSSVDLYMSNTSGLCFPVNHSQGNGWALSADVLVWNSDERVDTRPKQSIMLAPGYFGARYPLGDVQVHEGVVVNDQSIRLSSPMVEDASTLAAPPPVYVCPEGTNGIFRAALLGFASTEIVHFESYLARLQAPDILKHQARANLAQALVEMLVKPHLRPVEVIELGNETNDTHTVVAKFDPKKVRAKMGLLVFYDSAVFTDHFDRRARRWTNQSYPFEAVGVVTSVVGDTMTLHLKHPCLPSNWTSDLPKLSVPAGPSIISEAEALVSSAFRRGRKLVALAAAAAADNRTMESMEEGTDAYASRPAGDHEFWEPLLLEPKSGWARWKAATESLAETEAGTGTPSALEEELLGRPPLIGRVSTKEHSTRPQPGSSLELLVEPSSAVQLSDFVNERACVVSQRRNGHLFTRNFEVGTLFSGERVLVHLVVTGHGWAATSDQCGEYCHALYHLTLNGHSAANATQFRSDCPNNPIAFQYGTWQERRNGWCPGTVEHGLYFDVTPYVKAGPNSLDFTVSVWSHQHQRYEPYTNYAGFVFGDEASLSVDLSLLVYGADAMAAAMLQGRPYTPAEMALFYGSNSWESLTPSKPEPLQLSDLSFLEPPRPRHRRQEVTGIPEMPPSEPAAPSFLQEGSKGRLMRSEAGGRQERHRSTPFDLTSRAPWYLYNASQEGEPEQVLGGRRVSVFNATLVQSETRTVHVAVPADVFANFSQAMLYFRLEKPEGLELDDWDRQGSFGLVLTENGQEAAVHLAEAPVPQSRVAVSLPPRLPVGVVPPPMPELLQAAAKHAA